MKNHLKILYAFLGVLISVSASASALSTDKIEKSDTISNPTFSYVKAKVCDKTSCVKDMLLDIKNLNRESYILLVKVSLNKWVIVKDDQRITEVLSEYEPRKIMLGEEKISLSNKYYPEKKYLIMMEN